MQAKHERQSQFLRINNTSFSFFHESLNDVRRENYAKWYRDIKQTL